MRFSGVSLAVLGLLFLTACPTTSSSGPDEWAAECSSVQCGPGHCVVDVDHAACVCDDGYVPDGLHCVPKPRVSPCDPNPCIESGRGVCTITGNTATCSCDEDRVEVDGLCVVRTACVPSPCTAPFQSVCSSKNGAPVCECEPGHAPSADGNGCNPMPTWSCANAHSGSQEDGFEPDECPPNAGELTPGAAPTEHSIMPAGDVDWFRLVTEPGHVYRVTATSTDNPLYADAYAADGLTPIAADHHGTTTVAVTFRGGSEPVAFVSIRTLRGNDTASYGVALEDLGLDDFGDGIPTATELLPGATITGELQFYGDADVIRFPSVSGHAYSVEVVWSGTGELGLEVLNPDGTTRQWRTSPDTKVITRATVSAVWLRIAASSPVDLGGYSLTIEDLGDDDHGDVREEATPLATSASGTPVTLEREDDIDVLSFPVTEGHAYSIQCIRSGSSFAYLDLRLTDEVGATLFSNTSASSLGYEADASGTRYLEVSPSWSGSLPIAVQCRFEDLGVDDHGDDLSTATPISGAGATGMGKLELSTDLDVFSFDATAGHVYQFTCALSSSSCDVRLLGPTGLPLASDSPSVAWEIATAGTYYFEVSRTFSSNQQPLAYGYTLTDLGVDDCGDTIADASPVSTGASGTGRLETEKDHDVLSFPAVAGHIIQVTVTRTSTSYGYPVVALLDPAGVVKASAYASTSVTTAVEVDTSGTWYAQVSMQSSGPVPLSYSWTVQDLGGDDHGDDFAHATVIAAGDSGQANLEYSGDVDAFKFTPTAGRIYAFNCTRGTLTSCQMTLQNQAGTALASWSSSQNGGVVWKAPDSNPVVVLVGASAYSTQPSGTYGWALSDVGVDDHGDTTATATAVTLPMTAQSASLDWFGDVDVFSVSATAGHIYQLTCTRGTASNCTVIAKSSSGTQVGTGNYGTPVTAPFVAQAGGTYTFEVSGGISPTLGTYTWIVEDLGLDDHGNGITSATALTLDTSTAGSIEYRGDLDEFSFTASANRIYQVTCAPGTLTNCSVTLRSAAGSLIAQGNGKASFEAATSGTVYAEIASSYSQNVGTYSVVASDLGTDDHGDTWATATPLSLGVATSGLIEIPDDADYFSLSLSAGSHTVTIASSTYYLDVYVYGTNGTTYLVGGSSPQTFTATAAGTYYFGVTAWGNGVGNSYTITVN